MPRSRLLSELLSASFFDAVAVPDGDVTVSGVSDDSREIEPGYLFVAVPGVHVDGYEYIGSAVEAGAVAVVGERPAEEVHVPPAVIYIPVFDSREALGWLHAAWYDYPSRKLTLVGVTGTDGKTTTTNLIHSILTEEGLNAGMISTVNARIGSESYDTGLHTTTPPSSAVQRYLADMVAEGASYAVLETTSHGLAQKRLAGCQFDVAVVTNVTHEHLDYHGSWEAYMEAKAQLFENVADAESRRGKSPPTKPAVVLNKDDPRSFARLRSIENVRQVIYSVENSDAEVRAWDIQFGAEGVHFTLAAPQGAIDIDSPFVGRYNVSNILAAASAATAIGVSLEGIARGIAGVRAIPGRMERIEEGQDFMAVVDFAHTPNAMKRALAAANEMVEAHGRTLVVFGSAGLRDKEKRYLMGLEAGKGADLIFVTAEDPRTEPLGQIMEEIAEGLRDAGRERGCDFWLIPDRGEAILRAVEAARRGDIVMACGKGHEQSMCFGDVEYPWDDRQAMRKALRGNVLATLPTAKSDSSHV